MEYLELAEAIRPSKWNKLRGVLKGSGALRGILNKRPGYGATDDHSEIELKPIDPEAAEPAEQAASARSKGMKQLFSLLKLALPVALGMAAQKFMMNTTSAVVARLGSKILAGVVLGVALTDMCGDLIYGLLAPLCSLVSEAIGSGQGRMAGHWLQLTFLIVAVLSTPIVLLFWFGTGPIVSHLTPDPDVVEVAIEVNHLLIPGLCTLWLYTAMRLYVHGLKLVTGTTIAGLAAVFCNILMVHVLVEGVPAIGFGGIGIAGAAWAINISFVVQFAVCYVCTFMCSEQFAQYDAWQGWDSEAFGMDRIVTFSKLGVPLAVAGCAEAWGNRLLTMASGMLGPTATAAYNIGTVYRGMLLSIFSGFGVAIQVQVAEKLGRAKPEGARLAFGAVHLFVVALCAAMTFGTFVCRTQIAKMYADVRRFGRLA